MWISDYDDDNNKEYKNLVKITLDLDRNKKLFLKQKY